MNVIPLPRPCKVEFHSYCYEGVCLAIVNGVALVEIHEGKVCTFDLYSHVYSLAFLDRG